MAEGAVVSYLLRKLADPVVDKALKVYLVSDEIEQMQRELASIKDYLEKADSKLKRNKSVKGWVNQVRDIAYRMEDAIDTFLVDIEENSPRSSRWKKCMTVVKKPLQMNDLSGEIKAIKKNLNDIFQLYSNLGNMNPDAGSDENRHLIYRQTLLADDSYVVGLEADKDNIIKQLLDTKISTRMVLSILGPGGIGKTTLAQKVYNSAELKERFDCRIWLPVSQKFSLDDLLRKLLSEINPSMRQQNPTVEELQLKLTSSLTGKSYLIILDDVWTIELWDRLKNALPDSKNGSRIIITSRSLYVANAADCNTLPYELSYLNEDDSQALLFGRAFQKHMPREEHPQHLLQVANKLTEKCGRLPLALVVLGLMISMKGRENKIKTTWTKLETMDWNNGYGMYCSQVLAMSYEDLPYDLKPCFLYFASFPRNHKISGNHITRMWLAEELIQSGERTSEDKADDILQELVQRYLIQVTKKSWNGRYKDFSMHDLLWDLVIHQAMEENFFTVFPKAKNYNQLAARKPIRAAMQFCTLMDGIDSLKTRSLLCFGFGKKLTSDSGFKLLRVLTIEQVDMTNFPCRGWLKGLKHLRYIGFRYCTIDEMLFDNDKFNNLQTIDLKGTSIRSSKKSENKVVVPNLRHIHCPQGTFPLNWNALADLQTLKKVAYREVSELEHCINLRILWIINEEERTFSPPEEWPTLKGVLKRMEQLVTLYIDLTARSLLPFGGTTGLPCHDKIQSLLLSGMWGRKWVLSVEMFPSNITKLILRYSKLQEDPMPILEHLHSLRILQLLDFAYTGKKLICSTRGFPNLERLELKLLLNLNHWEIKEGAMPILSHLKIDKCNDLRVPHFQKLSTLQVTN